MADVEEEEDNPYLDMSRNVPPTLSGMTVAQFAALTSYPVRDTDEDGWPMTVDGVETGTETARSEPDYGGWSEQDHAPPPPQPQPLDGDTWPAPLLI